MSRRYLPRGSGSPLSSFALSPGEIVYDTADEVLRLGNGARAGGRETDRGAVHMIVDHLTGQDITADILAAQTLCRARGIKRYGLPAGTGVWTQNIIWQTGEVLEGLGPNVTLLKKTYNGIGMTFGDWGSGSGFYAGGPANLTIYHDYGTGLFPPTTPGAVANPTASPLVRTWNPIKANFDNVWMLGGSVVLSIWNGTDSNFNVNVYGIYDPVEATIQLTTAGVLIDGGSGIPTGHRFGKCWVNGGVSAPRTISWPNGASQPTTSANIGPMIGYDIRAAEDLTIDAGYVGACSLYGMRFKPNTAGILRDVTVSNTFMDACGTAMFAFDNTNGVAPQNITLKPKICNGQNNGLQAVTDAPSDLLNFSCINLEAEFKGENFVGGVVNLKRVAKSKITIFASNYNSQNFYSANAGSLGYDCAIRIAETVNGVVCSGSWGGGVAGAGGGYDTIGIRYTSAGNPASVTLGTIAVGTGVTQSAAL